MDTALTGRAGLGDVAVVGGVTGDVTGVGDEEEGDVLAVGVGPKANELHGLCPIFFLFLSWRT